MALLPALQAAGRQEAPGIDLSEIPQANPVHVRRGVRILDLILVDHELTIGA
jgi:hypothetical protein